MNKLASLSLFLSLFVLSSPAGFAEPELETKLSHAKVTVGETLEYTVSISWEKSEADYGFTFPRLNLTNLEVLRVGDSQESFLTNNSKWTRKSYTYNLHAIGDGQGVIHSYDLQYIDPATQKGGSFKVAEKSLVIQKQFFLIKYWKTILVYLCLAAIIGGMWYRISQSKKRKRKQLLDVGEDKEYESIKQWEVFVGTNENDVQTQRLSNMNKLFRQFIWEYYNIPKSLSSEADIMNILKEKSVSLTERDLLSSLLSRLTEANFMGGELSVHEVNDLQYDLNRFVEGKKIIRST